MEDIADVTAQAPRRRRHGGRAGHAARRGGTAIAQMPWAPPLNIDRPTEPLDADGVQAIHEGAMRVLEEVGIAFLNDEALAILARAGCRIEGHVVFMGRDFVTEMLARAPARFTLTPRNPDRAITVGGRHLLFGNVSSPPNYFDLALGRKVPGTRAQCADLLKLTQVFQLHPFRRRLSGRAAGHPRQRAAPGRAVRQAHAQRQGDACLLAGGGAGRGRDGDGAHRGWLERR